MRNTFTKLSITSAFLVLAVACGEDKPTTNPPPGTTSPTIVSFTASTMSVRAGATVDLTYAVTNADSVKIESTGGDAPLPTSTTLSGTVKTHAITVQTTFTLTAVKGTQTKTQPIVINVMAPDEVSVDSFTANPTSVNAGDSSTLSWMTTNATSVAISDDGGNTIVADGARLNDTETVTPADTTVYTITAMGPMGPKTRMVTVTVNRPVPVINSFNAMPNTIDLGQMSTLSWNVTGATTITVRDAAMNEVYSGADAMGTQTVMPTVTETYTLTAVNGFGMVMMNRMVTVNQPQGAAITTFLANPDMIEFGRAVQLQWAVLRATGGITITSSASGMSTTATTSSNAMGTLTVFPLETTEYTLTAINPIGDAMNTIMVRVSTAAPDIITFGAAPNPAPLNGETTLTWDTLGATDGVRLFRDSPNATELNGAAGAMGSMQVILTSTLTTFRLEATNAWGSANMMLQVVAQPQPVINDFEVAPDSFNGAAVTATVTWDVSDADTVELLVDGVTDAMFPGTATGTYSLMLTATTQFELRATSAGGSVSETAIVSRLAGEMEPNDTATVAQSLAGDGSGVDAELALAGDVDFYSVTVVDGGSIFAETSDGMGGCGVDTLITFYGTDGVTELGTDDDDGPGSCSEFDPSRDDFVSDLAAGTYFVAVSAFNGSATGAYAVRILVSAPQCGNGIVERRASEQCDDGNRLDSDNCDAMCQVPIDGVVMGPGIAGSITTFTSGLSPAGDMDYIRIDLAVSSYIRAQTFIPTRPVCTGGDTVIRLYDSAFQLIGSDDDDGVGSCSLIDPAIDAFALVGAGTYYIGIEDFFNNDEIAAFAIEIETFGQGCGNGIIEAAAPFNESCDDANSQSGDGCDNLCQFEGDNEMNPNDTFNDAHTITSTPSIIMGSIDPIADEDWYAVTVPAGYHLEAFLSVASLDSCPANPEARVQLYDTDGQTQLASNGSAGFNGNCGRIAPDTHPGSVVSMAGGTYYLRIIETGDDALIPQYFLHVNVIAPGCGNDVNEAALNEQCDDGNTTSGDGCSDMCQFEIVGIVNPPGGQLMVSLPNGGDFRIAQVNITLEGQSVTATAADSMGMCTTDTFLNFGDANFAVLASDDTGGPGNCAAFLPGDTGVSNLAVGTYYLAIINQGAAGGDIVLDVTVIDPECGNGILETRATEQCDDGNRIDGDGCSASCEVQALATYMAPGPTATIAQSIGTLGERDTYEIIVTADSYISATLFAPDAASGTCTGADTFMQLLAGDGTTELGNDDFDGPGFCSAFIPGQDAFTRLSTGTYFLTVQDFNGSNLIPAYELVLGSVEVDICGNGVNEAMAGETCDDGNRADGDGCSSMCQSELTVETEPNDSFATANATSVNGVSSEVVQGVIDTGGDIDYWTFVVPANATLTLDVRTHGVATDVDTCAGDTLVDLVDSTGTVLDSDDDGGTGLCSHLMQVTLPTSATDETYGLLLRYWQAAGPPNAIPYYMTVDLQ